jgi:hypothetical protein
MTYTDTQLVELLAEAYEDGRGWYEYTGWNSQPHYGFGDAAEAEAYCGHLNKGREVNLFGYRLMSPRDPDTLSLERGDDTDGFELGVALEAIADEARWSLEP